MIPVYKPYLNENNLKYAHDAIDSGWISSHGEYLDLVKKKLKEILGCKKIILTNNGTSATHLVAIALKYKYPHVKKIIVPNNVYVAAWNSFLFDKSFELIPIDSDINTWNIDINKIEEKLDSETAILVVHNIGNVVDVPKLKSNFPNTVIIEDNCEGFLGKYGDKFTGTESFASSISFFGNKTITSGEGGAFITNDDDVFDYINKIKNQGQSHEKFVHNVMGYNYRMTNIQASILYGQLDSLPEILENKNRVFSNYKKQLEISDEIQFQVEENNTSHSKWMFGVRFKNLSQQQKKDLELYLYQNGIETRPMFHEMKKHQYLSHIPNDDKNSVTLNEQCLILPSFPQLSDSQINFICDKILDYIKNYQKKVDLSPIKIVTNKKMFTNKNVIITATNSQYYESLLGLISSIHKFGYDTVDKILIYDIGLSKEEINYLENLSKVEVIHFTDEEKNLHPEFLIGKSHVYKNYCLFHSSKFNENVLWIDSGACFLKNFDDIFDTIVSDEIFFVGDVHLNKTYTHDECISIMQATEEELMSNQLWSGLVGFKSGGKYQELINLSSHFSLIPNCCNGNHQNHRHDQSILSILSFRYNCPQQNIDKYGYWTDISRNLQTALEYGSVVFAHRRGYIDKSNLIQKNQKTVESVQITEQIEVKEEILEIKNDGLKIKLIDENLLGQDGLSRYISPNTNWIRDINDGNYDIGIYTDRMCYNVEINPEKTNFAWLIEPPIINGENYVKISEISNKVKNVFSYNTSLSEKIDNFIYVPHGGTWLRSEDIELHEKTENISFIYSDKQWNMAHRLRHTFANSLKESKSDVHHFGTGSGQPIEYKINGLKNYRFSIVMENSVQDDYFTEKILDCFLSGTIPVYWGTKNIEKYFDIEGIVLLPGTNEWGFDIEESIKLINTLDESFYMSKLTNIVNNFNLAHKYMHPEKIIIDYIKNNIEK